MCARGHRDRLVVLPPTAQRLSHAEQRAFYHGHTYGGNPLAAAVGLASLDIFRDGKAWNMSFARGVTTQSLTATADSDRTGTTVTFKPDAEIFSMTEYSYETLAKRLRELLCRCFCARVCEG